MDLSENDVERISDAVAGKINNHICKFSEDRLEALNEFAEWVTRDGGREFQALKNFSSLLLDIKPRIISTLWNSIIFLILGLVLLLAGHSYIEKMWGSK
jgi:hypothetical protein